MNLLPWRNPLVATSFLVRNRRGGLFTTPVLYILLLGVAGMGVAYWAQLPQNVGKVQPTLVYFIGLMVLQLGVAIVVGGSRTAASIKAEVVNKTLDFQRLASVSSWDILLGKLFGEAALAYLLIVASFPMAFFCYLFGLAGLTLPALLLLYVNLFTTAIMFGSFSLQNTLVIPAGKATGGAVAGFGILLGLSGFAGFQLAMAGGMNFYAKPWASALIGLLTPIPTFFALGRGNPWAAELTLFGLSFPYLLITPVCQLLAAWLSLHVMARRIENLDQPVLGKPAAYGFLIVVDLLLIGILHSSRDDLPLAVRLALFCILHGIACVVVLTCVTPKREMLISWVWRFRGRRGRLMDEWLGDRSLNTLVVLTCMGLLATSIALLCGLENDPSHWTMDIFVGAQRTVPRDVRDVLPNLLLVAGVLILAGGFVYQWVVLIAGKHGTGLFFIAMVVVVAAPAAYGIYLAEMQRKEMPGNLFLALSPPVHLIAAMGAPLEVPNPWPLVAVYGAVALLAVIQNYRRTAGYCRIVDAKLAAMGVDRENGKEVEEKAEQTQQERERS